jgi:hypothetical protein
LKCYKTRQTNVPRFEPRDVTLVDQFGPSTATVTRPDRLCNPSDKNGEGMGDPTLHGMCYRLSESGFIRRDVRVENQFGTEILRVIRPETLCNPAAKDGVPITSEAANHFKCYKVRGTHRFAGLTVTVTDQFETRSMRVTRPVLLCNPVDKNGEGIEDPACHLVCYRIRNEEPAPFNPVAVTVEDQFWIESLSTFVGECRKVAHLCVPSSKAELP